MKNRSLGLTVVSFVLLLLVSAAPHRVQAADTLPNIYLGALAGYSASVDLPEGASDPMGVAIGARVGLTLPTTNVYVGGLFLYHLGDSVSIGTAGTEISSSSYMLGAEGGYELSLGPLVLRPSLGAGLFSASQSVSGQVVGVNLEATDEGEAFYLSPGINAMLKLGLLVGAELRYNAILDDAPDSISTLATLGLAF